MFSRRTHWNCTANPLIARLEDIQKRGTPVINLTESNPTKCNFSYERDVILPALANENNLRYEPLPKGSAVARAAVARHYKQRNVSFDAEKIFLTASTSEAYSLLLRLLTDPGDHILVPRPSYPLFDHLAQLSDVVMETYPLVYDDGWRIDTAALAKQLSPKTKAIILVNPNNPTGSFVREEELNAINALCKKMGCALISDEVFWDYCFFPDTTERVSLLGNNKVLTFVMGGASKSLALPQMKVSWTAVSGPDAAVDESLQRLEIMLDAYLSVNTPAQNALPLWLAHQDAITQQINQRLNQNHQCLIDCLSAVASCGYYMSEGGWYVAVRLPAGTSEEAWAFDFLEKDNVFVHPGYFFDFEHQPVVVISLLAEPGSFKEGMKRITGRVQAAVS